jgi:hypothetical protein
MTARRSRSAEHTSTGTKERVSECRKRLRRTRAALRALRIEQDEAVLEASELLESVSGAGNPNDSANVFEEAGASKT